MTGTAPEFSRAIAVEHLHPRENVYVIEASEAERTALAERFGIIAVDALKAEIHLTPIDGDHVRLTGHMDARVRQACVVTLVEVPAEIVQDFERVFASGDEASEANDEIALDMEGEDPPDPVIGGAIDIGEVAAEELALSLDPYPRAPGAVFDRAPEGQEPARANPFAVLGRLKKE